MKTNDEILTELESMMRVHLQEADKYKRAIEILQNSDGNIAKGKDTKDATMEKGINHAMQLLKKKEANENENTRNYVDYPYSADYFEKVMYFCHKWNRFWSAKEVNEIITELEGKKNAEKTIKSFSSVLSYSTKAGKLISTKMNGSRLYAFYGLVDWIQSTDNGYKIINGHSPSAVLLKNLTDAAKSPERMEWTVNEKLQSKIKKA